MEDSEILEAMHSFAYHMLAHTVRLTQNGTDSERGGVGSGMLYSRGDRLFLFSVLHNFAPGRWYIDTGVQVNERSLLLELPKLNWMREYRVYDDRLVPISDDGFAWAEFGVEALKEKLRNDQSLKGHNVSLRAYCGPIDVVPSTDEQYGFAASRPEIHPALACVAYEPFCELCLEYDGDDDRGLYRFRLAGEHRGKNVFKGSSGAPVADREGTIIGLIKGGNEEYDLIFVIPLQRYARALELQISGT